MNEYSNKNLNWRVMSYHHPPIEMVVRYSS